MIMVIGRFAIKPERRAEFLAFAHIFVAHERMAEGCLRFDLYEDITSPNSFLMLEQWASETAMAHHADTDIADQNELLLEAFFSGDPSFDTYEF